MSTFGGVMVEFPDVRVDYFYQIPGLRPPLACFLSHVHSDHLRGLASLKAPFVYCSAATKELLLRLETYFHRVNFAAGVLEAQKQQYKHLKNLLKPIPLETPTCIELAPGKEIQVTLFDANHCTGAVMFLIEGQGHAVLYTGDIRSEPWFVNNLTRNPHLIEYTAGLKTLDCIYLDTSNTVPIDFPTKADGLKELLTKVAAYPPDTVFHFTAYTYGYEEVWMALSRALKSPIHVDKYKLGVYKSLRGDPKVPSGHLAPEAPALCGYKCGNTPQPGCLTSESDVRIHSCEKGMMCSTVTENDNVVRILPIITRTKSGEVLGEIGVGGGGGDLIQGPKLELGDEAVVERLLDQIGNLEEDLRLKIRKELLTGPHSRSKVVSLDDMGFKCDDEIPISELAEAFARVLTEKEKHKEKENEKEKPSDANLVGENNRKEDLPRVITFPYSRHSSYDELCHLVKVFNPKDVYPCTVNEDDWQQGITMKALFGSFCSATAFRHDIQMEQLYKADECNHEKSSQRSEQQQTQAKTHYQASSSMPPPSSPYQVVDTPQGRTSSEKRNTGMQRPNGEDSNAILLSRVSPSSSTSVIICCNSNCDRSQIENGVCRNCGYPVYDGYDLAARNFGHAPSREIVAVSPNSASQDRRRKSIMDELQEPTPKRRRLGCEIESEFLEPRSPQVPGTWTAQLDNEAPTTSNSSGPVLDSVSQSPPPFTPPPRAFTPEDYDGGEFNEYFDNHEKVYRCNDCGHEKWSFTGLCSGCGAGEPAYLEVIDPGDGLYEEIYPKSNRIVPNEYDSDSSDEYYCKIHDMLTTEYIDYQSSAYDSQDSDALPDEYEIDSFIDDGSVKGADADEESSSSDEETDYKTQFESVSAALSTLVTEHSNLINHYDDLLDEHEEFKRDVLGSDYDSQDGDGLSDGDITLVDPEAPDPAVAEIVLSEAQDHSQGSEISGARARDRIEAFQAASDDAWHNISLVSTGDNHTYPELEL